MDEQALQAIRAELTRRVADALTRRAITNRGTFPPFRLPSAAQAHGGDGR